jgi:hypothetical protein
MASVTVSEQSKRRPRLAGISIGLLVAILLTGCEKEHCFDCFKSAGKTISQERECPPFRDILLEDRINLTITHAAQNRLTVEAGENLIDGVMTEFDGSQLHIWNANRCNWVRSFENTINITLALDSLESIDFRGAGAVTSSNTLPCDTLTLNFWDASGTVTLQVACNEARVHLHTGCGDAFLSGTTNTAYYYNRGNGAIRCSELVSVGTTVDSKCTNDCYIHAGYWLNARIGYIGNVWYAGHPALIDSVITERGRLIPLD